jgi:hypothetical protein
MSKRSIVALTVVAAVGIVLFFGGHHLWHAFLDMHGYKPH